MSACIKRLLVYPFAFLPPNVGRKPTESQYVEINSKRGCKIATYFVRGNVNANKVIIFSYGNASSLEHVIPLLYEISRFTGFSVIGYDYLGYGWSDLAAPQSLFSFLTSLFIDNGTFPSEQGCYESVGAVADHLTRLGYKKRDIIIMGNSIGCGPSTELAKSGDFNSLVLVSPFKSAISTVHDSCASSALDIFVNVEKIAQCGRVLIFHAIDDAVISVDHSHELYNQVGAEKGRLEIYNSGGHNEIFKHLKDMGSTIAKFCE
jgi:predicted alpha/beta hydrolase family esterase